MPFICRLPFFCRQQIQSICRLPTANQKDSKTTCLIWVFFFIFSLSGGDQTGGSLRKRNIPEETNDLDYLLKAHHQAQEQVAEEMLSLTKSLKEQSLAAKEVIGKKHVFQK